MKVGMRIGTSGSRGPLTKAQIALIRAKILSLPEGTTVVTGGCVGVDALIAETAYESGDLKVHTILPADHKAVDPKWREHCHTWRQMPAGTTYRDRDQAVVEESDNLLAFPLYKESDSRARRSGTWMTIRMARRAVQSIETFILDGLEMNNL